MAGSSESAFLFLGTKNGAVAPVVIVHLLLQQPPSSQLPAAHSHSIGDDIRNFVYYICMQGQPEITLQRF